MSLASILILLSASLSKGCVEHIMGIEKLAIPRSIATLEKLMVTQCRNASPFM
jgi:hypothetical protein